MTSLRPPHVISRLLPRNCSRSFSKASAAKAQKLHTPQSALLESLRNIPARGSQPVPSISETHDNIERVRQRRSAEALGRDTLKAAAKFQAATTSEEYLARALQQDMEMQITRRWRPGDVYAPHDLTGAEMRKWKKIERQPTRDLFDVAGINPLKEYKNFTLMSEYMTEMGRIKGRKETGLRPANQRKLAKAIARAVGIGIMPSVHRHPEILEAAKRSRSMRTSV